MKLKDYIANLTKLAKKYPNATVLYASDEEGNSYQEVVYDASAGTYDDNGFDASLNDKANAVCLN
jgi:hypothetical protein